MYNYLYLYFRSIAPLLFFLPFHSWQSELYAQDAGRIAIRMDDGKARFYHTGTGERFTPRGFNYIQLVLSPAGLYGESELFHPDSHDPIAIDDDFQRLASLGYNAVRVFVDLCRDARCIADENGLIPEYIGNIVHLLERAEEYGIYVMLTANWLPDLGDYSGPAHQICDETGDFFGGNCLVMSNKGVELYQTFFTDLVSALKNTGAPMNAIWAYELRNEFFVEHWYLPFTKTEGFITTANGQSYDMSSQDEKIKMGDDAVVYWANSIRDAIRAADPDALVTSGFFTPNTPNILRPGDLRIVPFQAVLDHSELDFFGIHAYAGFHDFHLDAENYGIIGYTEKPIVLGEYGAFLPDAPDEYIAAQLADHWQADACMYGVEGFTFWTWDRHRTGAMNPDDPWAGSDESAFIAKVLSPYIKVSSCDIVLPKTNVAEDKPTASSMDWENYTSANVVDGNATQTPWIAGSDPPQWVEVDLLDAYDLAAIQIVVETGSADPHFYTHEIQVRSSEGEAYQTIHVFADDRVNLEVLTYTEEEGLIEDVRFVRILIPQAPGWAALHELRALVPQNRSQFDVPAPPILTFPRPGMDTFSGNTIRWKNDTDGLTAQLQIASDPEFQDLIDDVTGITDDQYDIGHLTEQDLLYWRVRQTNNFGVSFWSVTGKIDRTSVSSNDVSYQNVIAIYPNPVGDILKIELNDMGSAIRTVTIHDLSGSTVHHIELPPGDKIIDVTSLHTGFYFLSIKSNGFTRTLKFVKLN